MTVFNLGSINIDTVFRVPHLAKPGETLAATARSQGLGGKGANMSVAAARAAARVVHLGAVGADGGWAVERLLEYGVDTRHICKVAAPTGLAEIFVDNAGENSIVTFAGANHAIGDDQIGVALSEAATGDIFITQNETNAQASAARLARDLGLMIVYAAAPFAATAIRAVIDHVDMLVLNEGEAAQLVAETGNDIDSLPIEHVIVTLGAQGCRWHSRQDGVQNFVAHKVDAVDTTGAGDTFTGYLVAGIDRGLPMAQAIGQAMQAAALMVTRVGAADVIPDLKDLQDARLG
ncbi:MAG: ribokinase [Pseudomonadota bacterium]